MISIKKLVILILNLIFLGFTIVWYIKDKTFEPLVAIAGGIIAIITYYITNDNSFSVKEVIISPENNSVNMNNSTVGKNTDIAGRDINKQKYHNEVGNIEKANTEIKDSVIHSNSYNLPMSDKESVAQRKYLYISITYNYKARLFERVIESVLEEFEADDWLFHSLSTPPEAIQELIKYEPLSTYIIFTKISLDSSENKLTVIRRSLPSL